jgi:hypothetical protein
MQIIKIPVLRGLFDVPEASGLQIKQLRLVYGIEPCRLICGMNSSPANFLSCPT